MGVPPHQMGLPLSYHDKIKQQKLLRFGDKNKSKSKSPILEDEGQSFADLLSRYDQKFLDLHYLMSWPVATRPVTTRSVTTRPVTTRPITTRPVTTRPWSFCNEEERSRCN